MLRVAAALAALLPLAIPARAQTAPDDDWTVESPQGVEADDSASGAERSLFWDESQRQLLIRFCWQLRLDLRPGGAKLREGLTAGALYNRHLRHMPDGRLAVVDQGMLHLPLDPGYTVKTLPNGAFFPLGVSALLDGRSTVVRPLEREMTCRELRRDAQLHGLKTVLPLEASRLAGMGVGELWQLPLTLKLGGKAGAVVPAGPVQATLTLSYSRKGYASVTLYRMAEDRLRLRLRLDSAEVRDARGEVVAMFPIAQLGLPAAEALIGRALDPDLARQVNEFLGPRIGAGSQTVTGRRGLLEYLLDPRDASQMEALAALLRGDLDRLYALAAQRSSLDELEAAHDALPEPVFKGEDAYRDSRTRVGLGIPLLVDWDGATRCGQDDVVIQDERPRRYLIAHRGRTTRSGGIGTPDMGHLQESRRQRLAQVITPVDASGSTQAPVAVYIQQESAINHGDSRVRRMVERVDDIMSWVGRERGAAPVLPLPAGLLSGPGAPIDGWSGVSFTLLFGQAAVGDILSAAEETVLRAADAVGLPGRAARALCRELALAASAPDAEERARRLVEAMSGKGRPALTYAKVMKVLVQLVDPDDLAAELVLQVNRLDAKSPDLSLRYAYHAGGQDDPVLSDIRRVKARFSPPSWLGD